MQSEEERRLNQEAYSRLREEIKQDYPAGRFVAVAGGRVVGDSADFMDLRSQLLAIGLDPRDALIVQAGVEYPEQVIIL